jgi:putative inorganic carbon (hco3(-)) transporter
VVNFLLIIFALFIPLENKTLAWFNISGAFNFTTIFLILIIIFWFIDKNRQYSLIIKNPLNLPIFIFIILTYLSLWTGYFKFNISPSGEEFHAYKRFITTFIVFFIVVGNCNDKKSIKGLINAMTFMVVLVALVVIKEFRSSGIWHYSDDTRFTLLGMNPNYLGSFFAQFIPLFASFFLYSKKFKERILYLILFLVCLPALLFTYSRGAYLSVAGALLIMSLLGGKKPFFGIILLLIVTSLGMGILFGQGRIVPVSVSERFNSIQEGDKSIDQRKEVWAKAKQEIKESPVIGYGYGATRRMLFIDVHNMYLKIAYDCGIPTLLVFIWLLIQAFKTTFKMFHNTKDDFHKAISLGFMGSLIALVIGNYFGERLGLFAANGYFAILMGIVAKIYTDQINLNSGKT